MLTRDALTLRRGQRSRRRGHRSTAVGQRHDAVAPRLQRCSGVRRPPYGHSCAETGCWALEKQVPHPTDKAHALWAVTHPGEEPACTSGPCPEAASHPGSASGRPCSTSDGGAPKDESPRFKQTHPPDPGCPGPPRSRGHGSTVACPELAEPPRSLPGRAGWVLRVGD